MSRLLLAALAALVFLVPATASGSSSAQLRGTVAAKLPANRLIKVDSRRMAHILRVPGSQARIRIGQRVELRGSTLRQLGSGSRVLARNVVVARSVALDHSSPTTGGTAAPKDDDEDENACPGNVDDDDEDDDDNSGPGSVDDDDEDDDACPGAVDDDDDHSGPGGGDDEDDDDDDSRGPGGGGGDDD